PETIAARRAQLAAAEADVRLAQETYDRQTALVRQGNTPQARVDEATRNRETAIRQRDSAQAALQLAVDGATPEGRAPSGAHGRQGEGTVGQREVDVAELTVLAPITGQVTARVAELGENFSAGAPLFSLIDIRDVWFTFNLREDLLAGLAIGDQFTVTVPAL